MDNIDWNKHKPVTIDKNDGILLCPKCNCEYTHLQGTAPYREKDNRFCLDLIFQCEQCGMFTIHVHQHKGITYLVADEEV